MSEAARLFNTKGSATSIGDVLEATGLEKGGLYRYFNSKDQLRAEAFAHAVATVSSYHRAARRDVENSVDALHAAIAAFEGLRGLSPIPGGCPLFNAAVEADDGGASLRGPVRRALAACAPVTQTSSRAASTRGRFGAKAGLKRWPRS